MTTPTREQAELQRAQKPTQAKFCLGAALILKAAAEQDGFDSRATAIGVTPTTAYGARPVPADIVRDIAFWILAQGVDGLGLVSGTVDPNDRSEREWWRNETVLGKLREIAKLKVK